MHRSVWQEQAMAWADAHIHHNEREEFLEKIPAVFEQVRIERFSCAVFLLRDVTNRYPTRLNGAAYDWAVAVLTQLTDAVELDEEHEVFVPALENEHRKPFRRLIETILSGTFVEFEDLNRLYTYQ